MPISQQYSNFTSTGEEEISAEFPRPPSNCWHKMRIKDIVEMKTKKGDDCFVQTSEFIEFKTPLLIRTYYLPLHEWSIARLENIFRNLGHTSRSADVTGAEFEAFVIEKDYEDFKSGETKKRLEIKKASLWLKVEDYHAKHGKKKDLSLPPGIPQQPSIGNDIVEDEIPF